MIDPALYVIEGRWQREVSDKKSRSTVSWSILGMKFFYLYGMVVLLRIRPAGNLTEDGNRFKI